MTPLPPLLLRGDCLAELARIPDASIDAVVTDPPYGLSESRPELLVKALEAWLSGDRSHVPDGRGFMGKSWDAFVPPPAVWDECMRILKPGGHMLAFAGSRTFDLMGLSIRLAGFEIRDSIAWLYGSGFPKSLDVSKAIDKAAGAEREVLGEGRAVKRMIPGADQERTGSWIKDNGREFVPTVTAPATDAAREWEGWGTALKPAFEPIVVARKPLVGTVAANVLAHRTGALNIDATRIAHASEADLATSLAKNPGRDGETFTSATYGAGRPQQSVNTSGRWPANVVLDESQAAALDRQSGVSTSRVGNPRSASSGAGWGMTATGSEYDDTGGASRFFYVAERLPIDDLAERFMYTAKAPKSERPVVDGTAHPTVKPLALTRRLLRLVTPPGGVVVDPFAGSGTTLEAAYLEGFESIGVELTPDYWPLIEARIARAVEKGASS